MKIFYFNIFLVYVFVMWQQQRIEEEEEEAEKKNSRFCIIYVARWMAHAYTRILVYTSSKRICNIL